MLDHSPHCRLITLYLPTPDTTGNEQHQHYDESDGLCTDRQKGAQVKKDEYQCMQNKGGGFPIGQVFKSR